MKKILIELIHFSFFSMSTTPTAILRRRKQRTKYGENPIFWKCCVDRWIKNCCPWRRSISSSTPLLDHCFRWWESISSKWGWTQASVDCWLAPGLSSSFYPLHSGEATPIGKFEYKHSKCYLRISLLFDAINWKKVFHYFTICTKISIRFLSENPELNEIRYKYHANSNLYSNA